MSEVVTRGRFYPDLPPRLVGETPAQYTDRLTGADGTGRVPFDHKRNRQCSIGWHEECSDPAGLACECPCHPDLPAWCTPAFMDKLVEALVPYVNDKVVDYPTGFISVFKIARYAAENVVPVVLAAITAEQEAVGRAVFGGGTPGRSGPTVTTVYGGAGGATPGADGRAGQSTGGGVGGAGGKGGWIA